MGDGEPPSQDHSHNPGRSLDPWQMGYVDDKLCVARRESMIERVDGMEKSINNTIKVSVAIAGFIISVIVLITRFIP